MRKVCAAVLLLLLPCAAQAQEMQRLTFDEAIQRAVTNHPTIRQAAVGILRAEAILDQVRSRSRP